ncbi:MAG: hypothetical protein PHE55_20175 [Methylococcaceae bacterium]|nr:hypothetical protein [Methylococcaceae bacterium]
MSEFAITCRWESAMNEAPEIRETSALLKIDVGGKRTTRNENIWSEKVRDEAHLSAYPIALWFAASWWRLRWEFLPASSPTHSWRMAHELAAAGYGYVWPRMLFAYDGEFIQIWATQSNPESNAAIRYLVDAHHGIPVMEYERVIDGFLSAVIARLEDVGLKQTVLRELWSEILDEREDRDMSAYRRLEAMLGFEPDECPESLHSRFSSLIPRAGADAIAEIAPICAASDPEAKLRSIIQFADSTGIEGKVDISVDEVCLNAVPWERGRNLAHQAREQAGITGGILKDGDLCDLLGISPGEVFSAAATSRPPLGLSIRHNGSKRSKFLFSKPHPHGLRFELARHLGNHLIAKAEDSWLPVTNTKTARQKFQRAFAAEFLCPIQKLKEYLEDDFSMDAIEDAAEHFCVSEEAVKAQLVNNKITPGVTYDFFEFPYSTQAKCV